jgi:hypothetical protein
MQTSSVTVVYVSPFFGMVGCWGRASTRTRVWGGKETTFAKVPTACFKHVLPLLPNTPPPHPYLYHNKKRLKMAKCMTLPNSITFLIQYRSLDPSSIILDRFYYMYRIFVSRYVVTLHLVGFMCHGYIGKVIGHMIVLHYNGSFGKYLVTLH